MWCSKECGSKTRGRAEDDGDGEDDEDQVEVKEKATGRGKNSDIRSQGADLTHSANILTAIFSPCSAQSTRD